MWCSTRINIRPILFLIYANDLNRVSGILDPIMFADDTNLFYSHKDIKMLFHTVNRELVEVNIGLKLINNH